MKENIVKSTIFGFLSVSCLLLFSLQLSGQSTDYSHFSQQVDSLFKELIKKSTPGAAVVVTKKGKPIFKQCYGLANLEHKVPITSKTVFNLASVSKQFTAFSILLLEKEGKVILDNGIHTYLPDLPNYNRVTVRHLLNHTSGIWDWGAVNLYAGNNRYDYYTLSEVMELLKHQEKLLFEPGSEFSYCNTNYLLLAQIVARITGESFSSWTKKNLFEPLGMKYSCFHDNNFQRFSEMASPYREDSHGILVDGHPNRINFAGSSGVISSIDDMVLWMDNFRTKKLGGNEVIDKMFQRGKLNNGSESSYGFGLAIDNRHEKKVIHHSGMSGGYKAFMLYCPENEVGITILANERSFDVEDMTNKIFGLYLGIQPEGKEGIQTDQKSYFTIDSSRVEDYIGEFIVEGTPFRLAFCYLRENKFYGIFEGQGQDFFYPVSDTEFVIPDEDVNVAFIPDEKNQMNKVKLNVGGNTMWANRIDFERLSTSQLSEMYAGKYYCHALGTVCEVNAKDNRLLMRYRRSADRIFFPVSKDEFASIYGIMRFKRDEQGLITGFDILDDTFNYNSIRFLKIGK